MYWSWLTCLLDSSLYPRFAAGYLAHLINAGEGARGTIAMCIVIIVTLVRPPHTVHRPHTGFLTHLRASVGQIKLRGTESMVSLSVVLAFISVAPSVLFIVVAAPHANAAVLMDTSGKTDWDALLTW